MNKQLKWVLRVINIGCFLALILSCIVPIERKETLTSNIDVSSYGNLHSICLLYTSTHILQKAFFKHALMSWNYYSKFEITFLVIKGRKKREKIVKGYCFRRKLQSACAVTVHFVHSNALRGTLPVSSNAALLSCLVICCGELRFLSYFVIIKTKDSKTDFYRLTTYRCV